MTVVLGKDGKERAITASIDGSTSSLGTLYLGLLTTLPTGYDGMDASTLLTSNEASITSFYIPSTGRSSISFGSVTAGSAGASISNDSSVSWTNNSGASVLVEGVFVTNSATGTSGEILWVGAPNLVASFQDGEAFTLQVGGMNLKVD